MPLQRPFDAFLGLTYGGTPYNRQQDPLGLAARSSMADERFANSMRDIDRRYSGTGSVMGLGSTVLPSSDWDGFWGAMKDSERGAVAQGGGYRVDLAGGGPDTGTAFGDWKMEEVTGPNAGTRHRMTWNQPRSSLRALQNALRLQQGQGQGQQ